jgi:hypothetical protein
MSNHPNDDSVEQRRRILLTITPDEQAVLAQDLALLRRGRGTFSTTKTILDVVHEAALTVGAQDSGAAAG